MISVRNSSSSLQLELQVKKRGMALEDYVGWLGYCCTKLNKSNTPFPVYLI